jgi:hypothetical protein
MLKYVLVVIEQHIINIKYSDIVHFIKPFEIAYSVLFKCMINCYAWFFCFKFHKNVATILLCIIIAMQNVHLTDDRSTIISMLCLFHLFKKNFIVVVNISHFDRLMFVRSSTKI